MSDYKFNHHDDIDVVRDGMRDITIFDYYTYSELTWRHVESLLNSYLAKAAARSRNIGAQLTDACVGLCWFKNHIHCHLRHMLAPAPRMNRDYMRGGMTRSQREAIHAYSSMYFYEHSQGNFIYDITDIRTWILEQKMDACVRRNEIGGRFQIDCICGLWGVEAPTKDRAEREAAHYLHQYLADGEYDAILYPHDDE